MITIEKPLLLSIVVPVYNRQERLDRLLADLSEGITANNLEQSIEVIVIDDCSKVPVVIPEHSVSLAVKCNKTNSGAPYSRMQGFLHARGEFIHFHDSDDSVTENWILEVVGVLTNEAPVDLLMTARIDQDKSGESFRNQKYFNQNTLSPNKIKSRLVYRNCMGPLGGVTFSRRVLEQIEFKNFASCQDWQMYIDVIKHAKVLVSRPDIKFIFNKTGDDRISHNPRKKILGHLQLAKITGKESVFGRNIRLFYLYTCKQHIYNKGGYVLKFYKKNRLSIFVNFLVVSVYWRVN